MVNYIVGAYAIGFRYSDAPAQGCVGLTATASTLDLAIKKVADIVARYQARGKTFSKITIHFDPGLYYELSWDQD